uniref:Sulfate_transp domain-containing protein n=1 Tax=Meloidogyne hapla TaxID=6305 RepID=A0A1I8BIW6_MELHA
MSLILPSGLSKNLWPSWEAISLSNLINNYTDNLIWSLFLTSTVALFVVIYHLPPDLGREVTGICASAAQIIGSFVCPYLIV